MKSAKIELCVTKLRLSGLGVRFGEAESSFDRFWVRVPLGVKALEDVQESWLLFEN